MKESFCEKFAAFSRAAIGISPAPMSLLLPDLLIDAARWLIDVKNDPAKMEEAKQKLLRDLIEQTRQGKAMQSDDVATRGEILATLRDLCTPLEWQERLKGMGTSYRTALNYIALAHFRKCHPEAWLRLKFLGPTKLYRLARLRKEQLELLDVDMVVTLKRGQVKFRHLTDRELEEVLRTIFLPKSRKRLQTPRSVAGKLYRLVTKLASGESVPKEELEELMKTLQLTESMLQDILERLK